MRNATVGSSEKLRGGAQAGMTHAEIVSLKRKRWPLRRAELSLAEGRPEQGERLTDFQPRQSAPHNVTNGPGAVCRPMGIGTQAIKQPSD